MKVGQKFLLVAEFLRQLLYGYEVPMVAASGRVYLHLYLLISTPPR